MPNHPNRTRLTKRELEAVIDAANLANEEPATWDGYDNPDDWADACERGIEKLARMLAGRG